MPGITLTVNGSRREVPVVGETPLLYVLRNDLALSGPQFGILSTTTSLRRANFANTIIYNGIGVTSNSPTGTQLNLTALQGLAADPVALVNELDRVMMHNTLTPAVKTSIVNAVSTVAASNTLSRARMALYLVASSSQYQIER